MSGDTLTPELCVVGGGGAGRVLAAAAAPLGVSVALIEPKAERGDRSDLALHALAAAARRLREIREAPRIGIRVPALELDFAKLREAALASIADLARNSAVKRLRALGVNVIEGEARFVDPKTLTVGALEVRPRRFVIAPRSMPVVPAIRGLPKAAHVTCEAVLEWKEVPRHLIVIGGGASGLALAQSFRRFGSDVTVLESGIVLHDADRECAAVVLDALARDGVILQTGVQVERVESKRGSVRAVLAGGAAIEGTHLLVAAGRRPVCDGLGLNLAGIEHTALGVAVRPDLRTTNPRAYAIGASAPFQSPHAAQWQARLVLANVLTRVPARTAIDRVPRVVATDPELAHVGLREEDARKLHRQIRILRAPYFENARAEIERDGKGMVKIVTTGSGRILGVTIVGAGAGEMIGAYSMAVVRGLNARALSGPLFPFPSRAEIGQQAVLSDFPGSLTNRLVQRIMALMRRLD